MQSRTWNFDGLGRVTSYATPEAGTVTMEYDSLGRTIESTDARGVVTSWAYDESNDNSIVVSYDVNGATGVAATPPVTWTFGTDETANENGRLISAVQTGYSEDYTYDSMGRQSAIDKKVTIGGAVTKYTFAFAWDDQDGSSSLTYPSTLTVDQEINSRGAVSSISAAGTPIDIDFGYTAPWAAPTTADYNSGVVSGTFNYDVSSHTLTGIAYTDSQQAALLDLDYARTNPTGGGSYRVSSIVDSTDPSSTTASYTYDPLGRLDDAVSVTGGPPTGSSSGPTINTETEPISPQSRERRLSRS